MSNCAGEGQRRAPLAGAGFGRKAVDAFDLVVIRLGDGGVRLVAARRTDALVLEVDSRRRLQGLFEFRRADQGRGPPDFIHLPHRFGDFDPSLLADFLLDERLGEDRLQFRRMQRLLRAGMQRRRNRLRQIGLQIVPGGGNVFLTQGDSFAIHGMASIGCWIRNEKYFPINVSLNSASLLVSESNIPRLSLESSIIIDVPGNCIRRLFEPCLIIARSAETPECLHYPLPGSSGKNAYRDAGGLAGRDFSPPDAMILPALWASFCTAQR